MPSVGYTKANYRKLRACLLYHVALGFSILANEMQYGWLVKITKLRSALNGFPSHSGQAFAQNRKLDNIRKASQHFYFRLLAHLSITRTKQPSNNHSSSEKL
ncbi:hypothetical protein BDF20DRAFT_833266 [Mycotypha africana]|uniref:uncharacterized protein n=1 Tax=Mycotypha africana TaxID=64632 RepID=UPI002301CEE3|nr:uncharacterized protein BDF20DRAFT_833266 [Mycotypha africana]KAI8988406.1 hypothetical protein BDF20DRAFT_833266 [Mycotypha africana]